MSNSQSALQEDSITFGKYKGFSLKELLRDRKYCEWLLKQEWFATQYEYLYNRVDEYSPRRYFVTKQLIRGIVDIEEFLEQYPYFHLRPTKELEIKLTDREKICYKYYRGLIRNLARKIEKQHSFNIKAPTAWLKRFEKNHDITRDVFKEFLSAYELPNIPYIVEDIKKMGGIDYKGARSFLIAKQNSLKQESFWERILKDLYGEDIGTQFKYKSCIFDFIRIKTNTLYECKLGVKDFNEDQHRKYLATLGTYELIYLIGNDCIVDLRKQTVYTTNPDEYRMYLLNVSIMRDASKFDKLIQDFTIEEMGNIKSYFS